MALDPMFMDFGLNLTKQYLAGRETDVLNAGIALNNETYRNFKLMQKLD
jgi:hypothetical protein